MYKADEAAATVCRIVCTVDNQSNTGDKRNKASATDSPCKGSVLLSLSSGLLRSVNNTDEWAVPFLTWNRSATLEESCPIVTARFRLKNAAYPFRLHLLNRKVLGLYVHCFLISCQATFSSFFITEKINTAETRQTPTNTPHTIHRDISPQSHAATAVK